MIGVSARTQKQMEFEFVVSTIKLLSFDSRRNKLHPLWSLSTETIKLYTCGQLTYMPKTGVDYLLFSGLLSDKIEKGHASSRYHEGNNRDIHK